MLGKKIHSESKARHYEDTEALQALIFLEPRQETGKSLLKICNTPFIPKMPSLDFIELAMKQVAS